jgi:hypothetical protein
MFGWLYLTHGALFTTDYAYLAFQTSFLIFLRVILGLPWRFMICSDLLSCLVFILTIELSIIVIDLSVLTVVIPSCHDLELCLEVSPFLYHVLDLVRAKQIEEFQNRDLPIFDLTQQGESEDSDQGNHANRDKRDQVHEKFRLIRGQYRVHLNVLFLYLAKRIKRSHSIFI